MNLILIEDVPNLGKRNDIVTVKNGYGRNYLIPTRRAMIASPSNLKGLEERIRQTNVKVEKEMALVNEVAAKLKAATIKVGAKVGTTEKIFGNVTNVQLSDVINKATGIELDRKKIEINEEIKTLGNYTAKIHLHTNMTLELPFEVIAE